MHATLRKIGADVLQVTWALYEVRMNFVNDELWGDTYSTGHCVLLKGPQVLRTLWSMPYSYILHQMVKVF